jgi:hypothetical protein
MQLYLSSTAETNREGKGKESHFQGSQSLYPEMHEMA